MRPAAAALSSFILPLLWLTPASTDAEADAAPVKVTVYYETLCPDSKRFITKQLYPVWQKLGGIMEVELKAHGKMNEEEPGKFHCQHGELECKTNQMMTCAKKVISDIHILMNFTRCIMEWLNGPPDPIQCAKETGVDFTIVQKCIDSGEGVRLQHEVGVKQSRLNPSLTYVPWILINDVFTWKQLKEAQVDLQRVVCEAYTGPCPEE